MAESEQLAAPASVVEDTTPLAPPAAEEILKEVPIAEASEKVEEPKAVEEVTTDVAETEEKKIAETVEAAEEKIVEAPETAEEKTAEGTEESKTEGEETAVERELPIPTGEDQALLPFKEESYRVGDLKESEKKALQELKLKIEEAIKANEFSARPKSQTTREVEGLKPADDGEATAKVEERVIAAIEEAISASETAAAASEEKAAADSIEEKVVSATEEEGPAPLPTEEVPAAPVVEEVSTPICEEPTVLPKEEVPATVSDELVVAASEEAAVETEPVVPEISERAVAVEEVEAPTPPPTAEPPIEEAPPPSPPAAAEAPIETIGGTGGEEVVAEQTTTTREVALEEPVEEDLALWGVPLLHTKGDDRTDVILLKFLRARDFKVNDAFEMLQNTVSWRKEFEADRLVEEDFGSKFEGVAYMQGLDKEGHPVCYNYYGIFQDKELYQKTMGDASNFKSFLRWRIQVLEKGIQQLSFSPGEVSSIVQITDFKDSPGFMKWRQMTKKALELLQDNYPELVAKQIFLNVPWFFGAMYSVYGRIFTSRQKSKVVVVRPGKVTETLFKYISAEHVPVKYGGLSRPKDTEFEGVEAPVTEVVVKAGEKQAIELPVAEAGTTVLWDLTVPGWEVVYGEEFVPGGEGGYTVIIQKTKKMAASEEPVRNSLKATEPGKIVLTIDNSASRRKRVAVYRYVAKKPVPATDY